MSNGFGVLFLLAAAMAGRKSARDRAIESLGSHEDTHEAREHIRRAGAERGLRDIGDARWGRGPLAGKTGNPFVDKPFFNSWAPGGTHNKPASRAVPRQRAGGYSDTDYFENPETVQQKARIQKILDSSVIYRSFLDAYAKVDIDRNEAEKRYTQKWGSGVGFHEYDEKDFREKAFRSGVKNIHGTLQDALCKHFRYAPDSGVLLIPEYGFDYTYGGRDNHDFLSVHDALGVALNDIAKSVGLVPFAHALPEVIHQQVNLDPEILFKGVSSYNYSFYDGRPVPKDQLSKAYKNANRFLVTLSHHLLGTGVNTTLSCLDDYLQNTQKYRDDAIREKRVGSGQTEEAIRRQWMLRP